MRATLRNILSFSAVAGICLTANGMSSYDYIQKYKDCAIEQMLVYNIPASVTLAQGMLESDFGNSPLAKYANNHFGIKCHEDWNGAYYTYDDDEKGEHFRKYQSVDDSYRDHAQFLRSRPWYSFLFRYPRTDYRDWAEGLSKAGYATARDYSKRLISIIQDNRLYLFDTILQNLQGFGILYDVQPAIPGVLSTPDYVVLKQGDGIYKVAREYNIDVNTLCRLNGITINARLAPGQKLYLKPVRHQSSTNTRPGNTGNKAPVTQHTGVSGILPRKTAISES